MSTASDPAMVKSNFERNDKERYWTEHWITAALMRRIHIPENKLVWEPAAGRGDIIRVLADYGHECIASDIDLSEFDPGLCPAVIANFLDPEPFKNFSDPKILEQIGAIVTNPPYDVAEEFLRKALSYESIETVAMLLRSEFNAAGGRTDLFNGYPFAYEIQLTSRPRWDWWFREKPEHSPRHNFSWFVWERGWYDNSTTYFEGKGGK